MQNMPCISLIGMPGAGKSTIGLLLAQALGYGFIDTDYLLEALYSRRLQDVTEMLSREDFLDAEGGMICALRASGCVIATGGSVIYRPQAMAHLKKLGDVVHLSLPLETVIARVALNPERGISAGQGQTLEDLYAERMELYTKYATAAYNTSALSAESCVERIISDQKAWGRTQPSPTFND